MTLGTNGLKGKVLSRSYFIIINVQFRTQVSLASVLYNVSKMNKEPLAKDVTKIKIIFLFNL